MEDTMINFRSLLIICLALLMSGCVANRMALSRGQTDIDLSKKSIALLTVRTSNQYSPSYQFDLIGAIVCPQADPCPNPRPYLHKAGTVYKSEKNQYNEYLVSIALEPGVYYLRSLGTLYQSIWNTAGGYAPIDMKLDLAPNTITYFGHITVLLRERAKESEKKAGRDQINVGILPLELKDKSIVGYSTGTFDILIEDKFDEDMQSFIKEYPGLQKMKVNKTTPASWKRPENQPPH
jgi:hypothetical protein